MQKYRKKGLLWAAGSLKEDLAGAAGEGLDMQQRLSILMQCQQTALDIGNYLEEEKLAGPQQIHLLEEYCEALYLISEAKASSQRQPLLHKAMADMERLKKELDKELPEDKKEVVFLPYKAAMWDSLESVWQAASADEAWDAYVIPIPYFDKKADGNLGRMHYEGGLYPGYVPITNWEAYDIEKRRPDVIFIHNPYDNANHVTSVHPDYYAKKLRQYTDELVYIPYFVASNGIVAPHLCALPGVIYADKVIVESDEIKDIYVSELRRLEQEADCRGVFGSLNHKILPLGSPKYDKVGRFLREEIPLPKEWQKLIEGPDGKRKKVFFYNTTLTALLVHAGKALDEIEKVFEVFRENEAVVLFWRPHPLYLQTIASMHQELYERYLRIVQDYRKEAWGIYDDTPDLERAVALSDAYYGDMSSVVSLFAAVEKPVMLQDGTIIDKKAEEIRKMEAVPFWVS